LIKDALLLVYEELQNVEKERTKLSAKEYGAREAGKAAAEKVMKALYTYDDDIQWHELGKQKEELEEELLTLLDTYILTSYKNHTFTERELRDLVCHLPMYDVTRIICNIKSHEKEKDND
jgi:hypothetical protein